MKFWAVQEKGGRGRAVQEKGGPGEGRSRGRAVQTLKPSSGTWPEQVTRDFSYASNNENSCSESSSGQGV